jgi:hypothetical protein
MKTNFSPLKSSIIYTASISYRGMAALYKCSTIKNSYALFVLILAETVHENANPELANLQSTAVPNSEQQKGNPFTLIMNK